MLGITINSPSSNCTFYSSQSLGQVGCGVCVFGRGKRRGAWEVLKQTTSSISVCLGPLVTALAVFDILCPAFSLSACAPSSIQSGLQIDL